jgi:hypothetical protein
VMHSLAAATAALQASGIDEAKLLSDDSIRDAARVIREAARGVSTSETSKTAKVQFGEKSSGAYQTAAASANRDDSSSSRNGFALLSPGFAHISSQPRGAAQADVGTVGNSTGADAGGHERRRRPVTPTASADGEENDLEAPETGPLTAGGKLSSPLPAKELQDRHISGSLQLTSHQRDLQDRHVSGILRWGRRRIRYRTELRPRKISCGLKGKSLS